MIFTNRRLKHPCKGKDSASVLHNQERNTNIVLQKIIEMCESDSRYSPIKKEVDKLKIELAKLNFYNSLSRFVDVEKWHDSVVREGN